MTDQPEPLPTVSVIDPQQEWDLLTNAQLRALAMDGIGANEMEAQRALNELADRLPTVPESAPRCIHRHETGGYCGLEADANVHTKGLGRAHAFETSAPRPVPETAAPGPAKTDAERLAGLEQSSTHWRHRTRELETQRDELHRQLAHLGDLNHKLVTVAEALEGALEVMPCPRADFEDDTCEFWAERYGQERCLRCAAIHAARALAKFDSPAPPAEPVEVQLSPFTTATYVADLERTLAQAQADWVAEHDARVAAERELVEMQMTFDPEPVEALTTRKARCKRCSHLAHTETCWCRCVPEPVEEAQRCARCGNEREAGEHDPCSVIGCLTHHAFVPPVVEVEDEEARALTLERYAKRRPDMDNPYLDTFHVWEFGFIDREENAELRMIPTVIEAAIRKEATAALLTAEEAEALNASVVHWIASTCEAEDEADEWRTRAEALIGERDNWAEQAAIEAGYAALQEKRAEAAEGALREIAVDYREDSKGQFMYCKVCERDTQVWFGATATIDYSKAEHEPTCPARALTAESVTPTGDER